MTADQWAEVFGAGAGAVSALDMLRDGSLPASLYGPAAISRALAAMSAKCAEIAAR
jgi:hypothetical protein